MRIEIRKSSNKTEGSNATQAKNYGVVYPRKDNHSASSLIERTADKSLPGSQNQSLNVTVERFGSGAHNYDRHVSPLVKLSRPTVQKSFEESDSYGLLGSGVKISQSQNLIVERRRKIHGELSGTNQLNQNLQKKPTQNKLLKFYEDQTEKSPNPDFTHQISSINQKSGQTLVNTSNFLNLQSVSVASDFAEQMQQQ